MPTLRAELQFPKSLILEENLTVTTCIIKLQKLIPEQCSADLNRSKRMPESQLTFMILLSLLAKELQTHRYLSHGGEDHCEQPREATLISKALVRWSSQCFQQEASGRWDTDRQDHPPPRPCHRTVGDMSEVHLLQLWWELLWAEGRWGDGLSSLCCGD